jgi:hypothetical protein
VWVGPVQFSIFRWLHDALSPFSPTFSTPILELFQTRMTLDFLMNMDVTGVCLPLDFSALEQF